MLMNHNSFMIPTFSRWMFTEEIRLRFTPRISTSPQSWKVLVIKSGTGVTDLIGLDLPRV